MSNLILEIKDLYHSYSEHALSIENINLEIGSGDRVSILGPSGCGKSTLLRLIAGLEKPDQGEIRINDIKVSDNENLIPPEKRNIGLVVQEKALFPHLSVFENICFGIKKNKDKDLIASELLNLLKIDNLKNKYPHEISGGEQQRVALARSLAPKPNFLMLDEPFSALDEDLKETLYKDISQVFLDMSCAILLVTHDRNEAEIMTNKQIRMEEGKFL
ncbi:ABC transporter ATP-binding protein [Gammaproteobacteria bacterium]|nr:ABC transporter ATP-binding protein [Gammaproteobacteria bacterium]MDC0509242.1 ABC transporter ATP-binding protein [Gammaproteobacteria bacterium]MDC0577254.1 ABC transporter ATP-binding protein [Gammaproteobacteria bacterium]MDC3323116.1 ABC transporter ATP-binding protein [Gammaproteobacteria bacterium]